MKTLGTRLFSELDQQMFARLSGDRNPIHMDSVAARRTQAGAQVVHGVHIALWSLEKLIPVLPNDSTIATLTVQFRKWVYVGDTVRLLLLETSESNVKVRAEVDGLAVILITAQYKAKMPEVTGTQDRWDSVDLCEHAVDLPPEEMLTCVGVIGFPAAPTDVQRAFPMTVAAIGATVTAALLATSTLVGMVCPGLHSMYSELAVEFCDKESTLATSGLQYATQAYDERFRMAKIHVEGIGAGRKVFEGTVKAFASIPPVGQSSMSELSERVTPGEFSGTTSLIVGGSRGLGELTAKALVAGGGKVVITYAVGKTEAESLEREIRAWGGSCTTMHYDVRLPATEQLGSAAQLLTHMYYFATPAIFRAKRGVFNEHRFASFFDYYVRGFFNLCTALQGKAGNTIRVFYPSSIAIGERPPDMTEYAMAKSAGEILCSDITRFLPGIQVYVKQLPRMETDQTATVVPVMKTDSLDTLLPILRQMCSRAQVE